MKPARWRPLALRDVDEAAAWYGAEGGLALELAFTKALESAVTTLMRNPAAGSSRHAVVLKLPQIRVRPLKRFPHLLFYNERATDIVIWRVLHMQRDIPAWMSAHP
ncbi:type II toxin-antitoxin system RelE/ParE family toxin [Xanthomonas campestris]|uniref:type II toxin-antitoxin system RelE/ParE family toxin n=1 Tax=Xanthomonas campestris TaxID=339 RepID=UPI000E3269FB|nr:type II toxin-antitoxin system RelE/ParE family toxin [Xanthomonas campestris]RFF46142.1 type II toxin-antitoxin system RelE/ParE family toxin [Xanthomonas campestris]